MVTAPLEQVTCLIVWSRCERREPEPRSALAEERCYLDPPMSKILCGCGHLIRDQADGLPYKAGLYPDTDTEALWDGIVSAATSLLKALRTGERLRWMKEHFLPGYPENVSDDGMLADAITDVTLGLKRDVYQCELCGRLYIQASPQVNTFAVFAPESPDARDCLRGKHGSLRTG